MSRLNYILNHEADESIHRDIVLQLFNACKKTRKLYDSVTDQLISDSVDWYFQYLTNPTQIPDYEQIFKTLGTDDQKRVKRAFDIKMRATTSNNKTGCFFLAFMSCCPHVQKFLSEALLKPNSKPLSTSKQAIKKVPFHMRHMMYGEHPDIYFNSLVEAINTGCLDSDMLKILIQAWKHDLMAWGHKGTKESTSLGKSTVTKEAEDSFNELEENLTKACRLAVTKKGYTCTLDKLLPKIPPETQRCIKTKIEQLPRKPTPCRLFMSHRRSPNPKLCRIFLKRFARMLLMTRGSSTTNECLTACEANLTEIAKLEDNLYKQGYKITFQPKILNKLFDLNDEKINPRPPAKVFDDFLKVYFNLLQAVQDFQREFPDQKTISMFNLTNEVMLNNPTNYQIKIDEPDSNSYYSHLDVQAFEISLSAAEKSESGCQRRTNL